MTTLLLAALLCGQVDADKAQLLFFTQPGCGACTQQKRILDRHGVVLALGEGGVEVVVVGLDNKELWRKYNVNVTPTLVLCLPSRCETREGLQTEAKLLRWLHGSEAGAPSDGPLSNLTKMHLTHDLQPPILQAATDVHEAMPHLLGIAWTVTAVLVLWLLKSITSGIVGIFKR